MGSHKIICGVAINDIDTLNISLERSYIHWVKMIRRCYYNTHNNNRNDNCYSECCVCQEWLTFSNFKKWFDDPQNGYKDNYCLDKDILVKGNKIYSPETCCFVPNEINTLIINRKACRGDCLIGVTKKITKSSIVRYIAQVRINGKLIVLGRFDDEYSAFVSYKKAKEKHVKDVAKLYYNQGKITKKVYDALMNYKVDIND